MTNKTRYALALASLLLVARPAAPASVPAAQESPPAAAAQAGYALHTFAGTFSPATVDLAATEKRGFQWYNWHLFGSRSDPHGIVVNGDGSVTLTGQTGEAGGELVSAVQRSEDEPFVGSSFGGGAYIEATIKWQPLPPGSTKVPGWPAFWAMALEGHMPPLSSQWPGQVAGYRHDIETDFFEALPDDAGAPRYGASLHDWYGVLNHTCAPEQACQVQMRHWTGQRTVPASTDFSQYHRYGFLWIPATPQRKGSAQFFFDGVQVGYVYEWEPLSTPPLPPPPTAQQAFAILDRSHLFLILGTAPLQPMTVRTVDVWQSGTAANLTNR